MKRERLERLSERTRELLGDLDSARADVLSVADLNRAMKQLLRNQTAILDALAAGGVPTRQDPDRVSRQDDRVSGEDDRVCRENDRDRAGSPAAHGDERGRAPAGPVISLRLKDASGELPDPPSGAGGDLAPERSAGPSREPLTHADEPDDPRTRDLTQVDPMEREELEAMLGQLGRAREGPDPTRPSRAKPDRGDPERDDPERAKAHRGPTDPRGAASGLGAGQTGQQPSDLRNGSCGAGKINGAEEARDRPTPRFLVDEFVPAADEADGTAQATGGARSEPTRGDPAAGAQTGARSLAAEVLNEERELPRVEARAFVEQFDNQDKDYAKGLVKLNRWLGGGTAGTPFQWRGARAYLNVNGASPAGVRNYEEQLMTKMGFSRRLGRLLVPGLEGEVVVYERP